MKFFRDQLYKEYLLKIRQLRLTLNGLMLFAMLILFFPLLIPPGSVNLTATAPASIMLALIMAAVLSSEYLFQPEYEQGVFEQWLLSGHSLYNLLAAKLLVHWLATLVPILILAPLIALVFAFTWYEMLILLLTLLTATPALCSLCALVSACGIILGQRGIFMALILLPLCIPLMVFATAALHAASAGVDASGLIAFMAAISLVTSTFMPCVIGIILRP